jgi:hypothetical protein
MLAVSGNVNCSSFDRKFNRSTHEILETTSVIILQMQNATQQIVLIMKQVDMDCLVAASVSPVMRESLECLLAANSCEHVSQLLLVVA